MADPSRATPATQNARPTTDPLIGLALVLGLIAAVLRVIAGILADAPVRSGENSALTGTVGGLAEASFWLAVVFAIVGTANRFRPRP